MVAKTKGRKPAVRQSSPNSLPGFEKSPLNISASGPFRDGVLVLVTLNNPREKFWGAILDLGVAGISVRGIELASFEDVVSAVVSGDPLSAAGLFFPMHRVERIELDLPEGALPSLSQRFSSRTGLDPRRAFAGDNRSTGR